MAGNMKNHDGLTVSRWRIATWASGALMLLLPLLSMQVADEVRWDLPDSAVFGALLVGVGVSFELKISSNIAYRSATGIAHRTAGRAGPKINVGRQGQVKAGILRQEGVQ